jgi:DNA-binding transcriptional MerR regulator
MHEQRYTRIIIKNGDTMSYYSEEKTSEYSRVETHIIRQLRDAGVIGTIDVVGEEPRYSDKDITVLRRARRLHSDLGINMEGVEVILRLYARLEALQQELMTYKDVDQQSSEEKGKER